MQRQVKFYCSREDEQQKLEQQVAQLARCNEELDKELAAKVGNQQQKKRKLDQIQA